MSLVSPNFQFTIKPSPLARILPAYAWLSVVVLVAAGPFLFLAKTVFIGLWVVLGVFYWRKLNTTKSFNQLRLESGNLILGFSNGQEPELVNLIGYQRVLPWLVELNILREDGKKYCWGITQGSITRDEFRQLKVFVKAQCF